MNIFLFVIAILTCLIIIAAGVCLFTGIRITFKFKKNNNEDPEVEAYVETFGRLLKKDLSALFKEQSAKTKSDKAENDDKNKSFAKKLIKYYNTFLKIKYTYSLSKHRIYKNIFAEKIRVCVKFGLDDAAETGMATGALWAGVYNVIAFFANIITITEPDVRIVSDYDNVLLDVDAECIILTRPVNIIVIICSIAISYMKVMNKIKNKEKAAINYGNTD